MKLSISSGIRYISCAVKLNKLELVRIATFYFYYLVIKCDQAYESQSCECKLHRVIFSLISFVLKNKISFSYAVKESLLNYAVRMKIVLQ